MFSHALRRPASSTTRAIRTGIELPPAGFAMIRESSMRTSIHHR